jgi:hypothetical protein
MIFLNKRRVVNGLLGIAAIATLLIGEPTCFAQTKTVNPTQIPDLLSNPDIGYETFQTISSSGVTTPFPANLDKKLPSWLPSGVMYVRPSWAEMEPSQGVLSNWLDNALTAAHNAGQKVALRPGVTLRWPTGVNAMPSWVMSLGASETNLEGSLVPAFNNSGFVTQYVNFIKLLGQKYDSDPRLGVIDIGGIGAAENEWHMSPFYEDEGVAMPPFSSSEQPIIAAFAAAFPHHPLVMGVQGGGASTPSNSNQALGYAGTLGAGWRGDCFGDTRFAMVNPYPTYVTNSGMVNSWKNGPVALESCYDIAQWPSQGYASYRAIYNYGLAAHASLINNKSIAPPTDATGVSELQRFIQRLGYRLVLNQITFPDTANSTASVSMQWQNVGSAPCYAKTYRVGYRLVGASGDVHVFTGQVNPCTFMPGDLGKMPNASYLSNPVDLPLGPLTTVTDSVALNVPAGTYTFSVGIVDTSTSNVVVKLAIAGRDAQGWYPMGNIYVAGGNSTEAPSITSTSPLQAGTAGTPYSLTVKSSGTAPMTWAMTGGALPSGLALNSSSGVISGTPGTAASSSFTVAASNAAGTSSRQFSLTINSKSTNSSWFEFVSKNSAKCLDVPGASTTENIQLQQYSCSASDNQKFQLTPVSGGYKITAKNSGLQVNVRGGTSATQNGAAIIQWPYSGASNEIWKSAANVDGTYSFSALSSGKCMDVSGSSLNTGAVIVQSTCTGASSQHWGLVPVQ